MARRAEPSAKTVEDIESFWQKSRTYQKSGDTRYREAEAEVSAVVESMTLPCLLALFKDYVSPIDFERLMMEAFVIISFVADVVADTNSHDIPRDLHKFVSSPKSRQRVQQLMESASIAVVLSQDFDTNDKRLSDRWKSATLLTRFVALADLHLCLVMWRQSSVPSIRLQKNSSPQANAASIEVGLLRFLDTFPEAVDRAYRNKMTLKNVIKQRLLRSPEKIELPVCISLAATESSFAHKIDSHLVFWCKDFEAWSRNYGKWKDERMKSWEWCPEIWEKRKKKPKNIQKSVVMTPSCIYDFVLQRALAAEPNVAVWRSRKGFENLLWAPYATTWSEQARKKGVGNWLIAYEEIDNLPANKVWTSPGFSELVLDLIDIVYYHWSKVERPPSFILTDAELFHYRDRKYPEVSERKQQHAAMRQLQQFRFFHKKIVCDYENEESDWDHEDRKKCINEGLLRCTALAVTGRNGKFSEYTYYIEILGLWRGRFERPPHEAVVHGAACSRKLWAQSGRKRLVRQLARYLRTEWRWNARQYVLDKEVCYRSWREHLEQCDVPLEIVMLRPGEFYSRLATALTALHEEGLIKAWHIQGANETEFVTGKIYTCRKTDDKISSDAKDFPLQSLVCDPLRCAKRGGFDAFLEQKIGFVPHDSIIQSLMPVAKRQKKKHI